MIPDFVWKCDRSWIDFYSEILWIIKLNPENYYVSTVPVDLNPIAIISISLGILIISGLALIIPSYLISKISPVKAIKYN
jgi:lipoprotein-releasing system permease protein